MSVSFHLLIVDRQSCCRADSDYTRKDFLDKPSYHLGDATRPQISLPGAWQASLGGWLPTQRGRWELVQHQGRRREHAHEPVI